MLTFKFDSSPCISTVYSRVAYEWDWIKDTICENSDEKPEYCDDTPRNPFLCWLFSLVDQAAAWKTH